MTLEILTSPLLEEVAHGFFTRRGGASSGVFHGLNCGQGSSDQDQMVRINRQRVAQAMGVEDDHLVTITQTHSPDVVVIDGSLPGKLTGDAMVSKTPGIALGILTADCQPVLFFDRVVGVVGAAHAGWKGARAGVLENTLAAMEKLGAKRENTVAVIGPTISQKNYEVGADFREAFVQDNETNARFFTDGRDGRAQFDLPAYGLTHLRAAGVKDAAWTQHCTYEDEDRFFSFRRATHRGEADYGRLISVIRL